MKTRMRALSITVILIMTMGIVSSAYDYGNDATLVSKMVDEQVIHNDKDASEGTRLKDITDLLFKTRDIDLGSFDGKILVSGNVEIDIQFQEEQRVGYTPSGELMGTLAMTKNPTDANKASIVATEATGYIFTGFRYYWIENQGDNNDPGYDQKNFDELTSGAFEIEVTVNGMNLEAEVDIADEYFDGVTTPPSLILSAHLEPEFILYVEADFEPIPEETTPQTTAPETTAPETTVPETTTAPETTVPETTTVAETTAPETTTVAETTAPETTTVAMTTAPETTTVAETTAPETTSAPPEETTAPPEETNPPEETTSAPETTTSAPKEPEPEEFEVTVIVIGEGSVPGYEGTTTFNKNTILNMEAVSLDKDLFDFAGWSGDGSGTNEDLSIVVDGDLTIIATFVDTEEIEDEATPESGPGESDDDILDVVDIPVADIPQTGGLPIGALSAMGTLMIGLGTVLKRKKQ